MKIYSKILVTLSFLIITISLSGIATSCNTTELPPPDNAAISITLADVPWKRECIKQKINELAQYNATDIESLFNFNQPTVFILAESLFSPKVVRLDHIHTNNLNLINHRKLNRAKKL